jgi:dimethylamine monooxygenase subunit A
MSLPGLPPETIHLPFEDGPFRMAMGLLACPEPDWIELDERYPAELAERRGLLTTRHADAFAAIPGSEAARAEVLAMLAAHLPARYPAWFRRDGHRLHNALTGEDWDLAAPPCDPLELAGRLVQEDLCLVRPEPDGPVLEAALLCAPSRWRLAEKIGLPLLAVHAPVPLYAERLGRPVDRFMGQLKPGRIALRMNWSVVDDAALFQLGGKHRTAVDAGITTANAGARLHLRTERQTFRRLPRSGRVLFTIRVHSYPLARIAALPGAAPRLAAAVRALPEAMGTYKSLPAYCDALLTWLEDGSAGPH